MVLNTVVLGGNIVADATSRSVGENAVVKFRLAVKAFGKGDTLFIDVESWNAEKIVELLKKGTAVAVEGRLHQDNWENDGKKFSKVFVKSNSVQLLGSKKETSDSSESSDAGEDPPF